MPWYYRVCKKLSLESPKGIVAVCVWPSLPPAPTLLFRCVFVCVLQTHETKYRNSMRDLEKYSSSAAAAGCRPATATTMSAKAKATATTQANHKVCCCGCCRRWWFAFVCVCVCVSLSSSADASLADFCLGLVVAVCIFLVVCWAQVVVVVAFAVVAFALEGFLSVRFFFLPYTYNPKGLNTTRGVSFFV